MGLDILNDDIDRLGATAFRIAEERNLLLQLVKLGAIIRSDDYAGWREWLDAAHETLASLEQVSGRERSKGKKEV